MTLPIENKVISFCTGVSRTFFTANGGFLSFVAFQPASRQARMGVAVNIREPALEILSDTHGRNRAKPRKGANLFVVYCDGLFKEYGNTQVTPTAKRNSYRVASACGAHNQKHLP